MFVWHEARLKYSYANICDMLVLAAAKNRRKKRESVDDLKFWFFCSCFCRRGSMHFLYSAVLVVIPTFPGFINALSFLISRTFVFRFQPNRRPPGWFGRLLIWCEKRYWCTQHCWSCVAAFLVAFILNQQVNFPLAVGRASPHVKLRTSRDVRSCQSMSIGSLLKHHVGAFFTLQIWFKHPSTAAIANFARTLHRALFWQSMSVCTFFA